MVTEYLRDDIYGIWAILDEGYYLYLINYVYQQFCMFIIFVYCVIQFSMMFRYLSEKYITQTNFSHAVNFQRRHLHVNGTIVLDATAANSPDNKVHGAKMEPTWVLSAPDGPPVDSMNLAIRVWLRNHDVCFYILWKIVYVYSMLTT